MHLLFKPPSTLAAVLGLGLVMSCAPSTPEAVLEQPTSQATVSDAESSSPSGAAHSAAVVAPTTETPPSTSTATVTSEVSSPAQEAIASTSETSLSTTDQPITVFAEGSIAIRGADPVGYFTQGTYVAGSPKYTYVWGGATWQFANAEHRELFISNPWQYAPQYGGFCAWAVSEGYIAPIDPTAWDVVNGKLYLNFNDRIQKQWQQDIPGHIARANQNWPGVLDN